MTPQVLTILIAGLLVGAGVGAVRARARKGSRFDVAHFALVYGVIGFVVTVLALVTYIRIG
ncbi:MAG: apolipoprotein acyltransferase [Pseudomonadota bacterium]